MRNASGMSGLLAALVLWSGGWLGCGGVTAPTPETSSEAVEEHDALPSSEEEMDDETAEAPDVSAAWHSPSRSCKGLVPSGPGEGRMVTLETVADACLPGTSDGRGNLALGTFISDFDSAFWTVFTPDGERRETFSGGAAGNVLMPQKSGFHVVSVAFGSDAVTFRAVSRTGALLVSRTLIDPVRAPGAGWSAVVDPRGGSVVSWVRFGPSPDSWQVVVQRFGTSGEPRSPLLTVLEGTGTAPPFTVVGADTQGRALVLWREPGTTALHGRWLRRNETFTSRFLVAPDASGLSTPSDGGSVLGPLIGGGLALKLGGRWVASIPSKKTSVQPAPAWLAARPETTFSIIRGCDGYALLSSTPGVQNELEILAPAGNACGDVRLPFEDLREIRVGRDGTVVAQAPRSANFDCVWRYWPRLLH